MLKWIERLIESITIENERQFHGRRINRYEINKTMQAYAWKKNLKNMGVR
jgi:hypothetical protein